MPVLSLGFFTKKIVPTLLLVILLHSIAQAQTPVCAVAGDAGNYYETCSSGVCEGFVCNGTSFVTVSSRAFAGWESKKFGNDTQTCNADRAGRLRYGGGSTWEYCNGTTWTTLVSGGSVSWPQSVTSATGGDVFQISGSNDNFLGFSTDANNTSVFVGREAGNAATTISNNTFVGYQAGKATTTSGVDNTFVGYSAGVANTSGYRNTFIGSGAGITNTSGIQNTFVGNYAGAYATGSNNTAIGRTAGYQTTGSNNVFAGHGTGYSNTSGSNNILIGYGVNAPTATTSEYLNIGNAIYGTLNDGDGTIASDDNDSAIIIDGSLKIGTSAATCNSTIAGTIRYNSPNMQFCNGSAWTNM